MNWKMTAASLALGMVTTAGGYIAVLGGEETIFTIKAKAEEQDHQDHTDEPADAHGGHDEGQEEGQELILLEESLNAAGIRIEVLTPVVLGASVMGPAEIQANAYRSSIVTPRVPAIVIERHVKLSDTVKIGTPLVTIFSREAADAEGAFLVADREWRRVRRLGREVVSERRYLEAEVVRDSAEAQLLSYGFTQEAVDAIAVPGARKSRSLGEFTLLASQDGTVVSDDFKNGELVEPGQTLVEIIDLENVWAIARMSPNDTASIRVGSRAWIRHDSFQLEASVEQIYSTVDEETRTVNVRLLVPNVARTLRPGQFAQAEIESVGEERVLAVPNEALVRSADGDWVIFVQDEDLGLKPVEVERVRVVGGQTVIEGIPNGSAVAISGAFFLQSELAKSGFDIHNH